MKNKKTLLILPLVAVLSSCGYDLNEVVTGDVYNSPILEKNDYKEKNGRLNPNNIVSKETRVMKRDEFLLSYKELQDSGIDPYVKPEGGLRYLMADSKKDDSLIADFSKDTPEEIAKRGYGPSYKLNRTDDMFSYGVLSKLYDGNLFCNVQFELSRVQINEDGFNVLYPKNVVVDSEKDVPNYLAIQLKADIRHDDKIQIGYHTSSIDLHFSFFIKDMELNKFIEKEFVFPIDELGTNPGGSYDKYNLLVLPLNIKGKEIDIKGACGYSISYKLKGDEIIDQAETQAEKDKFHHRVMLYEILLPGSRWR